MALADGKYVPCKGDTPALAKARAGELLRELSDEWEVVEGRLLRRQYRFSNFSAALDFVNRIGAIAEAENHHPDLTLGWGYATVEIYTHSIGGLSENDFILAAKIDRLAAGESEGLGDG